MGTKKVFTLFVLCTMMIASSCQKDKYKVGSVYSGFRLTEKRFVEEVNADVYYFEHIKSGAHLLKIAADDANKTFSIGFKTPPQSDCGTPHIMEHSVLNGSKNFPVKSPFDVLAKGSLNTFLNAMTGSDLTVYPVASMNDKDYFNLMHVYLDAVFNPLIYSDERIFKQEGWHHELVAKDDPVSYKGVVYNEMKGAFSNPLREMEYIADKNLFPDNCYQYSSGGYPETIPQLTYEQFLDFHRKYYHPSNSYIFLYGDAEADSELAFIDANYLSHYKKSEDIPVIKMQKPFTEMKRVSAFYPLPEGSDTKDQTFISLSWVIGEGKNQALDMALDVLSDALVNHESGPVRLALQEAGLGRDVTASNDELKQNVFKIRIKNANPADTDAFYNVVIKALNETVAKGIDKNIIKGIINRKEFRLREGNDAQKGMALLFRSLGGWWYGNDPFLGLEWEKPLKKAKTALDTTALEDLIQHQLIDNPHALLLTMEPKPGLETERKERIQAECDAYKASLNSDDITALVKDTQDLIDYQKQEDSKDALATIPMLELKDINPVAQWYPVSEESVAGVRELVYPVFTNHIVYTTLLFNAQVLPQDLIPYASLLTNLLGSMNTDSLSFGELDNELNINTGGFNTYLTAYLKSRDDDKMMPKFSVYSKAMSENTGRMYELMGDIVNHSALDDSDRLKTLLTRHQSRLESSVRNNGMGMARTRLESYYSNSGMFDELTSGISYYWFVTDLMNHFDENSAQVIAKLQQTSDLLFNKANLIATVVCGEDDLPGCNTALEGFIAALPDATPDPQTWSFDEEVKNEGFLTASKVQYVMKGYDFKKLGYEWNGKIRVLNQILSREWLNNQIRVVGGAYGGFSGFSSNGLAYFGSYRDPNLKSTLENIDGSPEFLSSFEPDESEMTRFIIGTISRMDRPLTPAGMGQIAVSRALEEISHEQIQTERDEVLAATAEDIRAMSPFVRDILAKDAICVYGNEEKINSRKDLFKKVLHIEK